jgi:hypothetical protein
MFKVGDKVVCLQGNEDFLRSWVPDMNNYVGRTARIIRVDKEYAYFGNEDYIKYYIDIDDGEWIWTNKTLKLKISKKLKTE